MYFYKTNNAWVIGDTPNSFVPLASYFMQDAANAGANEMNIIPMHATSNLKRFDKKDVTKICKNAAGEAYGTASAFFTAVSDYFAASANPAYVKGDKFVFADFTEEELAALKGAAFVYADFTEEQLLALKGAAGDNGLFTAALAYCADYAAIQTAMIAAGLMEADV